MLEDSPLQSPATENERPRLRRARTSSSLSGCDLGKRSASVYLTVRSAHSVFGAFSPTPDAHAALAVLVAPRRTKKFPPLPTRALTIPSISRTAAPFSAVPVSPSSAPLLDFDTGYATPRPTASPPPPQDATAPALASLERRSRLCATRTECATCGVPGTNFPACGRCGAVWCSRACRLPNGVRHVCNPSPSSKQPRPGTGISTPPVPLPP
ncbi:hypothetical protein B0H12DRAFT_658995 [Mycena haematopus]|nr:hypothetical protein B0H12DRAFT_658995 [Mycena haematopus]